MWQRSQTLYLSISTILIGVMFFCAKAVTFAGDGSVAEKILFTDYFPYTILLVVITFLNILALTTFKFRVFQLRTAMLTAIVTSAFQAWLGVDFYFTHSDVVFRLAALFPVAAIILDIMAYRGILADQLLVESAYSLRKARRERRSRK